jgi:GNAT superfamily N-acetyltransferase
VKEFHGSRDISTHADFIRNAFRSLDKPQNCHSIGMTQESIDSMVSNTRLTQSTYVLIATQDGKPRGVATAHIKKANGRAKNIILDQLCTTGTCRGAGRALIEHMMTVALKHRCPYIELQATRTAIPFYEHLGFTPEKNNKHLMKLNVLWYFSCYIRSLLSDKDKRNIGMVFL